VEIKIWTVGHSTHSAERFNEILLAHSIETVVDVRTFPASRRFPQFNQAQLTASLESVGVGYRHNPQLGGRRKPSANSRNTAWQNASFRAYADHMETAEFRSGIEKLLEVARETRAAIMCAESLWWRCHRSLISDFLKSTGVEVIHILNDKKTEVHPYTSAARIVDGELSYVGLLP
jgi:uncharacterized protein (DUF488 family)